MTSLDHPRLSGLGRNPAAPQDVLVRLAAHPAGRHGMAQRHGQLADAVAEALLTHGGGDSAVRLHGDRVSARMRRRIAGHPDPAVRDAFADSVRGMVELGVPVGLDHLEEVHGRPRAELVRDPDPELRVAVTLAWTDRPLTVQRDLLADPDPRVRSAATQRERPGIPPEWRERCLADPATRAHAAAHVPLTAEQFERLLCGGDERVLHAVAGNPHLSAELTARLLDVEDPEVRLAVARSRHADAVTRDRLYGLVAAERAAGSVAAQVALDWSFAEPTWLRKAPLADRLAFLDCPYPVFRRVLAACPDLPEDAWRRLDDDPDPKVRRTAARRPDAPPRVLERLARTDDDSSSPTEPPLVDHPRFPRHLLRTFADDPNPRVRHLALRDAELPVLVLRRLAADDDAFVRRGAARHPRVTAELLEALLADPDPEVADEAAANPALRRDGMERILTEAGL
ncbi:hypothetical protein [Streptomyces sp. NPDC090025]|uniref:hypothetical protein n=1 Tax=Streptomyces sp. NPDC090025 TaxID=3365922 RepID=UPI003838D59D